MRTLTQPGPVHPRRIDVFRGEPRTLRFPLHAGLTLNDALTGPMTEAGFQSGTITVSDTALGPFRYVMPGPPDDASHVAYFTAPRAPEGITRIERAAATFGWSGGKPALHCHAAWVEAGGSRRGGHILPHDTVVAEDGWAIARGFDTIRIEAAMDEETNFPLFQPSGPSDTSGRGIVARVKPNEDIVTAIEILCRDAGITDAVVRGSLGSLIGARFTDGGRVDDLATEVLVRQGWVRDGRAALELLVVDMQGEVHEGWLERGDNPVLITFDLVLEIA